MALKKTVIRKANKDDMERIWKIFSQVVQSGDTYVFDPQTPEDDLNEYWFGSNMDTFVLEAGSEILGTYIIKPNQPGLGSHIANCSYMVHPQARGKGMGQLLGEHSIQFAKAKNYLGIQFNVVVSTNTAAIALWQKLGFQIIGTTPNGFRHEKLGLVDTYIMYRPV